MNTTYTTQQVENMLVSEIKNLVAAIDKYLTSHPEGSAFIPKRLLKTFTAHTELKDRYKPSASKYAYVVPSSKTSSYKNKYLTSYTENVLIHYLFLASAYHKYDYNTHNLLDTLPQVVNAKVFNLSSWGIFNFNKHKSNIRSLDAINTIFTLVTEGTTTDYLNHINKKYTPNLNDSKIKKVVSIPIDGAFTITFMLSDTHCVAQDSVIGCSAKISDNHVWVHRGQEFLLTPDGILVLEMQAVADGIPLITIDFQSEIETEISLSKASKSKKK
ncbi:hypothetical protein [Pseudomonas sp. NBRC 111118]|uniref:hypothetical protein n=1 Tax=Pseudomonas sp. NBRC 111118 TaxID=1661033 RepID=UPI000B02AFC8|nr:hypothetical protein [Pseudomonas sp. NBRC 111118]